MYALFIANIYKQESESADIQALKAKIEEALSRGAAKKLAENVLIIDLAKHTPALVDLVQGANESQSRYQVLYFDQLKHFDSDPHHDSLKTWMSLV